MNDTQIQSPGIARIKGRDTTPQVTTQPPPAPPIGSLAAIRAKIAQCTSESEAELQRLRNEEAIAATIQNPVGRKIQEERQLCEKIDFVKGSLARAKAHIQDAEQVLFDFLDRAPTHIENYIFRHAQIQEIDHSRIACEFMEKWISQTTTKLSELRIETVKLANERNSTEILPPHLATLCI